MDRRRCVDERRDSRSAVIVTHHRGTGLGEKMPGYTRSGALAGGLRRSRKTLWLALKRSAWAAPWISLDLPRAKAPPARPQDEQAPACSVRAAGVQPDRRPGARRVRPLGRRLGPTAAVPEADRPGHQLRRVRR